MHTELDYSEIEGELRVLRLAGRVDLADEAEIEIRFAGYCPVEGGPVLVDMEGVEFMSSIGIRMLAHNAKSLAKPGGKMVLLNPTPAVRSIPDVCGIPFMVPTYAGLESAVALEQAG